MPIPITAREPVSFKPKALADTKPDVEIVVRVPTMIERDRYGAALVRAGIVYYTQQQIRDLSLAGVQDLFPADQHDELVALLEEFWAVRDNEQDVVRQQAEKLHEIHDKAKAKGEIPDQKAVLAALEEIKPTVTMDARRKHKALSTTIEISAQFKPLTDALASLSEQDSRRAYLNAQTYVVGWRGLEHEPDPVGASGLKQVEADYLREQIGEDAWEELDDFITSMQAITKEEEKNSDSLLGNISDETGSTASEPSPASSDIGTSTAGGSTPTRKSGSRKTTASSSGSSKSSATKTNGSSGATPTAGR